MCGSITALLHGAANLASAEMAGVVGAFSEYERNRQPMQRVMQMHREAVETIGDTGPAYLKQAARQLWDKVIELGERYGYRNAQATVLAPTGTISFMMDCDTTGIEPDIALVKYKQLAGGGMLKIVNRSVALGLETLGYQPEQVTDIIAYVDQNDTIEGAPHLKEDHLAVLDCAFKPANGTRSIPWQAHVRMMRPSRFCRGRYQKRSICPATSRSGDIAEAYYWGWELGLKAIAIYRDGSKQSQPLNTKSEGDKKEESEQQAKVIYRARRERLPDTRHSLTHKFNIAGHEGYLNVGLYPDGRPGELFITMAKEGSTVGGLMDAFGTAISMSLQYGVPLEVLVNKFSHTRFEPMGHTTNPDIRIAKSVVDYIFRWLGITFLAGYHEANGGSSQSEPGGLLKTATQAEGNGGLQNASPGHLLAPQVRGTIDADSASLATSGKGSRHSQFAGFQSDAPSCDNCGAITVRNGNCYLCHNCGNSMGCS